MYEVIGDLEGRQTGGLGEMQTGDLDASRCLEPMRASYRFA
jgi:hypothetical protein